MTEVEKFNQELFDYLCNELNCIATQTEMQEIEAIVMSKHKQQYVLLRDISEYPNAQDYYNKTFKK